VWIVRLVPLRVLEVRSRPVSPSVPPGKCWDITEHSSLSHPSASVYVRLSDNLCCWKSIVKCTNRENNFVIDLLKRDFLYLPTSTDEMLYWYLYQYYIRILISAVLVSLSLLYSYLYQCCTRIFIVAVLVSLSLLYSYLYQCCTRIFIIAVLVSLSVLYSYLYHCCTRIFIIAVLVSLSVLYSYLYHCCTRIFITHHTFQNSAQSLCVT
jgi:hypothetical protein